MQTSAAATLTDMQRQCLRRVLLHYSSKDIARELNVSPHTVDNHLKAAMQRLNATSRFDAARILAADEADIERRSLTSQRSALAKQPETTASTEGPGRGMSDPSSGGSLYQGEPAVAFPVHPNEPRRQKLLPVPSQWGEDNTLSKSQRLFWILAITVFTCLSIGAIMGSLRALNDMF
jgi:DNA-binding CsgD family transcriptional regulator